MPRGGRGQLPVHRQAGVSTDIRTAGRNRSRCRGSRVFASHTGHCPPQGDRARPRAQRSARPCPCFVGRNARPDNHRDLKRSGMCSLASLVNASMRLPSCLVWGITRENRGETANEKRRRGAWPRPEHRLRAAGQSFGPEPAAGSRVRSRSRAWYERGPSAPVQRK